MFLGTKASGIVEFEGNDKKNLLVVQQNQNGRKVEAWTPCIALHRIALQNCPRRTFSIFGSADQLLLISTRAIGSGGADHPQRHDSMDEQRNYGSLLAGLAAQSSGNGNWTFSLQFGTCQKWEKKTAVKLQLYVLYWPWTSDFHDIFQRRRK